MTNNSSNNNTDNDSINNICHLLKALSLYAFCLPAFCLFLTPLPPSIINTSAPRGRTSERIPWGWVREEQERERQRERESESTSECVVRQWYLVCRPDLCHSLCRFASLLCKLTLVSFTNHLCSHTQSCVRAIAPTPTHTLNVAVSHRIHKSQSCWIGYCTHFC